MLGTALLMPSFFLGNGAYAQTAFLCPQIKPMPIVKGITGRYKDGDASHSVLDSKKVEQQNAIRSLISASVSTAVKIGDHVYTRAEPDAQRCLVRHLEAIYASDPFRLISTESEYVYATWLHTALGISYLKLDPQLQSKAVPKFKEGYRRFGMRIRTFYERRAARQVNNLNYWGGLAVGLTGVVTQDCVMIEYARSVLKNALASVDGDGVLAEEVRRGAKARHYHLFAAAPLITTSYLIDYPLSEENSSSMRRMADAIINSFGSSGGIFQEKTGVTQDDEADGLILQIVAPFAQKSPIKHRDGKYFFLGGNLNFLQAFPSTASAEAIYRYCPRKST